MRPEIRILEVKGGTCKRSMKLIKDCGTEISPNGNPRVTEAYISVESKMRRLKKVPCKERVK